VAAPRLEVVVLTAGDCAGAAEGGADRLELLTAADRGGLTPDLETIAAVRAATALPLRVRLRLREDWTSTGGELTRLVGLARTLRDEGVDGFTFGFVAPDLEVDLSLTEALAAGLDGAPWAFHRAFDQVLNRVRAYRDLVGLPGLDGILTAGSARGVEFGLDELCREASSAPDVAALVVAGGGLRPEDVPWLARAGVRAFHVGQSVRPGGSSKAYVDAGLVRSWRTLVDDAVAAAL
jgi:copper homeostasis protein